MTQKEQRERDFQAQRSSTNEHRQVGFKEGWDACVEYHAGKMRLQVDHILMLQKEIGKELITVKCDRGHMPYQGPYGTYCRTCNISLFKAPK